jgi:hypothetical protein
VFVPRDRPETRGPTPAVFALLGEDPSDGAPRRVHAEEDEPEGGVVDMDGGRREDDGILELFFYGAVLLFSPL